MKRTKIIATIGPATESTATIEKLAKAGANGARLNFSHGTHEHHSLLIKNVRAVAKKLDTPIAVIQDLQGPRIRLGELPKDGIAVKRGDRVALVYVGGKGVRYSGEKYLTPLRDKRAGLVAIPVQEPLGTMVREGEAILIKDGLVRMVAEEAHGTAVIARVEQGDVLTSNRGINLPESNLPDIVITEKDEQDVAFGIKQRVDWLALSFVRNARDIKNLRTLLPSSGEYVPRIIAKIERAEAVENFDEILKEADAIMVARGDLGIELPAEEIPLLQKRFIEESRRAAKPVIVATQMLESMTTNSRPTRAEVSDVANAVIDHADCLMLSGETSTGKYPVETCRLMADIIAKTEASPYDDLPPHPVRRFTVPSVIAHTADDVTEHDHIRAIVVMSASGTSARLVASERPEVPIIALTQNDMVRRQLALSWGISPYLMKRYNNIDALIDASVALVKRELNVKKGDNIIIASGHPTGPHGSLNLLKIHTV
ncbi:MAG: pyruvate kinase [Parcubacteria group bacterium]|nr:pyruvate kinase [Parcubacteria group bacterium]